MCLHFEFQVDLSNFSLELFENDFHTQAAPGAYWSGAKMACHQRMDMGAAH
jgi:hypothetical protein